jgi:hypothetical protein
MKKKEFYEKHFKVKQEDGSFANVIVRDSDKLLLNGLDNGKTVKIVKGRRDKIVLV